MLSESPGALLIRAEAAYHDVIADPGRGRKTAEEVAAAARAAGAAEALVVALRAAGWAARELYDHRAAQRHLGEAARTARRTGLDERLCEVLLTRSSAYLELGHAGRARRDLVAARKVAGKRIQPEVTLAEGLLEEKVGNFGAAAAAFRRALDDLGDDRPDLRVKALNNLALEIVRFGEHAEAERLLAEALALAETFSPTFAGFVTESQATVAIASGRPVLALRRYEQAEQRLTAVGAQLVDLYLGKADALFSLRLLEEAAAAAARAVTHVDGVPGGSLMLAEALLPQARIALAREHLDQARAVAARAEELFRHQRRTGWHAAAALLRLSAEVAAGEATPATLRNLRRLEGTMTDIRNRLGRVEAGLLYGDAAARMGRRSAAINGFGRASEAARGGTVLVRLQGWRAAARRAELLGDSRRLAQFCRRGLDELAAYQASFASIELRARAVAHGTVLADIGVRQAVRVGRAEQIWNWLERGHAMAFVQGFTRADKRVQPLLSDLRAQELRLLALPPEAAGERSAVIRRIDALQRQIRSASWIRDGGPDRWTAPSVQSLRALRSRLGERVLLQYGVIDRRVHAVAVTRHGMRVRALAPVATVTDAARHLTFALRRLSQQRSAASTRAAMASARTLLDELATQLVLPFHDLVTAADEVVVAVRGELMSIPWGMLGPLGSRPVRVTPSATAWQYSSDRRPASERVVLVAGPDLAEAVDEVQQIADGYARRTETLTGAGASSDAVLAAVSGARLVHLACHGRLRADSPTFSSLRLDDGPLTVHDLEELDQPAHHWILAACDLGSPGTFVGRGLEGVLAALLSGGAGAVVAAIVSIPDVSTRPMMVQLHRCLAEHMSLASALQHARSAVDLEDPSGFVSAVAFTCYGGG